MNPKSTFSVLNRYPRLWLSLLLMLGFTRSLYAQTTLTTGDLVFVGYNTSDDQTNGNVSNEKFSFVLLKDVAAGTRIFFTDYGWLTGGGFQNRWTAGPQNGGLGTGSKTDAIISWTASTSVAAGTQIVIQPKYQIGANIGTVACEEAVAETKPGQSYCMDLSDGGSEQLFAYQASSGRGSNPRVLAGVMIQGAWSASLINEEYTPSKSTLPGVLTANSVNAALNIFNTPFFNNFWALAIYNCATNVGFPRTIRNAINTTPTSTTARSLPTNWVRPGEGTDCAGYLYNPTDPDCPQSNIPAGFNLPINCTFTVYQLRIVSQPVSRTVCSYQSATFSVAAQSHTVPVPEDNNITYKWQSSTDGTNWTDLTNSGVYSGVTSTTLTVNNTAGLNSRRYRAIAAEPIEPSSVTSTVATLTVNEPPQNLILAVSGPLTCTALSANLTAGSSTGGTTYAFSGPTGAISTSPGTFSISVNQEGGYSVRATAPNGCTASTGTTVIRDITPPANVGLTVSGPLTCTATSVTLTAAASATSAIGYAFRGPQGSVSSTGDKAVVSQAGTYTVTATAAANGCSATATTGVTSNTTAPTASLTNNGPISCSTPSVTLTAGTDIGTRYAFSVGATQLGGSSGNTAIVTNADTYSVVVTADNGCTATASTTVTGSIVTPTASLTNSGPLSCTNSTVTLTASGGVSYTFSGPGLAPAQSGAAATVSVTQTGTYTVVVTGVNGCTATAQTTVTGNANLPLAFTGQPASASTVVVGTSVTTMVSVTGTGPLTYQWYKNSLSSPVAGQISATLSLTNVQLSDAGSYSVVVTGTCNSLTSTAFALSVNAVPLMAMLTASPNAILTTGTTTLSATVSGGTTPYSYTFAGPGTISPIGNTATVSAIPAGVQTFTVLVTDAADPASQTVTATVNVTVSEANQAPVATANNNQTATVGVAFSYTVNAFTDETPGSLTYTASINPANGLSFNPVTRILSGTPSLSGVTSVTVTATDPGSLSANTSFIITVSPAPVVVTPLALTFTASPTQLLTTGTTTLSATVSGGTTSYSYVFTGPGTIIPSGNTASVSGLPVGVQTFTVVVTDASIPTSQTITGTVSVTVSEANTPPVATANANQTATVGVLFSYTVAAFTDTETPNSLTYSARIDPANGLSFDAATRILSGTPSLSGVSSVTVVGTDPGSLSASTSFTITVNPAPVTPTAPFSITGVTTLDCTPVANRINLNFNPRYAGLNGQPIRFSVVNELSPTTAPGPYTLQLYTDNPIITLKATQSGTVGEASFTYNWLAACNSLSMVTPTNTAPTTTGIANQSGTVNQGFSLNVASSFSDAETPNALSYSAIGLPAGLSLSGSTISGTPSVSGVSTVTVTATDPGSLSVSTSFSLTVSPAASMTSTGTFSITGVTTIDCTPVANRFSINFNPRYAGLNGQTIRFRVENELSPTTAPGPYSLTLYPDNPVITLRATQSGTAGESTFSYNWLAACNSLSMVTPNNTAPTTTGIANQSGTVNQGFALNVASSFSDAETPNTLSYSATGLPAGLSLSGSTISGTPSTSGVSTVTVRATDPGSLSVATSFTLTVSPATSMTSTAPFSITGVSTVSCSVLSAGQREVRFSPQYAGTNGQPISFSVVNELSPTTAPGPYTLRLYTDNPIITLKATQSGTAGEASFSYNWLAACNSVSGARLGAEPVAALEVRVLGNPMVGEVVEVEVRGGAGKSLRLETLSEQGYRIDGQGVEQAGRVEHFTLGVGASAGVYLLRVSSPSQSHTLKLLKK